MRFGSFGMEPGMLVAITQQGGLLIKMLRRTEDIVAPPLQNSILELQNQPLPLPTKTKLFLEQRHREKTDGKGSVFLRSLNRH